MGMDARALPATAGLRILLLESDRKDGERLLRVLQGRGYCLESRFATTQEELLAALADGPWAIAVLAGNLPTADVGDLLRSMRERVPEMPVVLAVDRDQSQLSARLLAGGICDFVLKSNPARLLGVVERECGLPLACRRSDPVDCSEARFLQLARNIPECYWLTDVASGQVAFVNQAYEQIWGHRVEDLYADLEDGLRHVHPEDIAALRAALVAKPHGGLDHRFRILRPGEQLRWLHVRTFEVHDERGQLNSVGGIATDITEVFAGARDQIRLAHFDSLTALPNQLMFYDQARQQIALARRKQFPLAVLLIDIDQFRELNQTLGYFSGDELLRQIAGRLSGLLRESDVLGRLGGDVFAALLPDVSEMEQAGVVARRVIETLIQPIRVEGRDVFATASIGIAFFPDDGKDAHELLTNAEAAMRQAKKLGRNNYQAYAPTMHSDVRNRLYLETDLRNAILNHEFLLHYQPKACCTSGRIVGVEALVRWQNPRRGLVPPDQFIPLLEETGLILPVGRWVLREACRQMQAWYAEGLELPSVSVNLSARQLESDTLVRDVAQALADSELPAGCLDLEITESMLMQNADAAVLLLGELKAMGVTLSLDDFGTGYSSLAYLKRFPLDTVKVDRSFVQDIAADADDASITRAVITMAHHLKLQVVAEGVETAEQLALLISHQCDVIQGYFFSRPLPAGDMATLLRAGKTLPAHLLRSPTREPLLLFVAVDDAGEIRDALRRDGHRVEALADCAAASAWLAVNRADVVICGAPRPGNDTLALLNELFLAQAQCHGFLLADAACLSLPALNQPSLAGRVRILPLPLDPLALRSLLEETLSQSHLADEFRQLQQEVELAERQLLRVEHERRDLLDENRRLQSQSGLAARVLEEVIGELPWPMIGVDLEGVVVMANDRALACLGESGLCLGLPLADTLPALAALVGDATVDLGERQFFACWRSVRLGSGGGRLLVLEELKA